MWQNERHNTENEPHSLNFEILVATNLTYDLLKVSVVHLIYRSSKEHSVETTRRNLRTRYTNEPDKSKLSYYHLTILFNPNNSMKIDYAYIQSVESIE